MAQSHYGAAADQLVPTRSTSAQDEPHGSRKSRVKRRLGKDRKATLMKHKLQRSSKKRSHGYADGEGDHAIADGGNNEDDDDDDGNEADNKLDEDGEPEVFAPSGGQDTVNPSVCIDSVSDDVQTQDADHRQAGPALGTLAVPATPKKRTLSNVSIFSSDDVYSAEAGPDFPRKRIDRKLSNNRGLWQYSESEANALRALAAEVEAENAVVSDDGDDEIYKKVEEIEDSDVELDDVRLEEEEEEVASVDDQLAVTGSNAGKCPNGSDDDEDEEEIASEDEFWMSQKLNSFFGTGMFGPQEDLFGTGTPLFEPLTNSGAAEPTNGRRKSEASERRVRFDDNVLVKFSSASSSSESSEFDFNTFPDLLDDYARTPYEKSPFTPLKDLNSDLREQIRASDDGDFFCAADSDATSSEFDFGEREAAQHMFSEHGTDTVNSPETADSGLDDSASLSGYDSDGDTTDEDEIPPMTTVTRPRSVLHSPPTSSRAPATPKTFPRSRATRRGPRLGTFTNDNRPFAYYDPRAHRIMIRNNPQYSARLLASAPSSALSSPLIPFSGFDYESDSGLSQSMHLSSLFQGNVDVMMSGVFGGPPGQRYHNGQFIPSIADLYGGHVGTPETFFAQAVTDGDSPGFSTESDFDVSVVNVSEFIDMQSDLDENDVAEAILAADSDNEADTEEGEADVDDALESEEMTPVPKKSLRRLSKGSQSFLDHLDGLPSVTSFKNNQDRYRVVSKLPHDRSHATKPLKTGKSAEDVMTPPRKRKRT